MAYIGIDMALDKLQEQINRIEDDDANFKDNERWKELRKKQEDLWAIKEAENERSL